MNDELHYYLYLSRPPGTGCQPVGFDRDSRETWLPGRVIDGRSCLGRVGYLEQLSPEDVYHYNLRPESETERAELPFWKAADWVRAEYLSTSDDELREFEDRDIEAWAALVLRRAARDGSYDCAVCGAPTAGRDVPLCAGCQRAIADAEADAREEAQQERRPL